MTDQHERASVRIRPLVGGNSSYQVLFTVEGKSRSVSFSNPPAAEMFASVVRYFGAAEADAFLRASAAGFDVDADL